MTTGLWRWWMLRSLLNLFVSCFTASERQLGQDSVWVQDTENCQTSHCGYGPRGHWWPQSGVRYRHRARVLLVKPDTSRTDCWTDSWHDQPSCTYEYEYFASGQNIYCAFTTQVQDVKDLQLECLVSQKTSGENQNHSLEYVQLYTCDDPKQMTLLH